MGGLGKEGLYLHQAATRAPGEGTTIFDAIPTYALFGEDEQARSGNSLDGVE